MKHVQKLPLDVPEYAQCFLVKGEHAQMHEALEKGTVGI
jgi:hypothetical protein